MSRLPTQLLTAREDQVLALIAEGRSNQTIADAMGISYETVKEHVQNILRKIGVSDRTQAAIWDLTRRPTDEARHLLEGAKQFHVDAIARINEQLERMGGPAKKAG